MAMLNWYTSLSSTQSIFKSPRAVLRTNGLHVIIWFYSLSNNISCVTVNNLQFFSSTTYFTAAFQSKLTRDLQVNCYLPLLYFPSNIFHLIERAACLFSDVREMSSESVTLYYATLTLRRRTLLGARAFRYCSFFQNPL